MNVLQAHPYAILGSEFCDNVYYMPPEELFSDRASAYRLRRWIDNLKAYQAEKSSLQQALHEKDELMREVHHRVKNNLNLVLSLIRLKGADDKTPTKLTEVRSFIESMCLIHDKLHKSSDSLRIEFADFADELLENIVSIFPGPPVTVSTDIPATVFGAENARNLGLVLNEIVTNAMKHGFNGENSPHITVRLEQYEERYVLTVSNNGNPFPDDVSLSDPNSGGTGTRLIASIVDALGGSIVLRRSPRTEIHLEFPVSSLKPVE